jgi:hypothetical protein
MGETPAGPDWLQFWSTGMSILAFVFALLSMWMVGSVAFPLYSGGHMKPSAPGRLKGGIGMTFAAIIMMALAGMAGWWPTGASDKVQVSDGSGNTACGRWVEGAPAGSMWLETESGQRVTVSLKAVSEMRQVSTCS